MVPAFEIFLGNLHWMGWNFFLAVIPFLLSIILFRAYPYRNLLWWLGLGCFILFLPNAAYIVTDIIHFIWDVRQPEISRNGAIFVVVPQYVVFLLAGFQCHVLSLLNLGNYLLRRGIVHNLVWIELGMNLLCAFGIYLGRFNRLNSWHVITQADLLFDTLVDNLGSLHFFLATLVFFGVITTLYYPFKWVDLAIATSWQKRQMS